MCEQISSNLYKNEITAKLILHIMYIYLNVCKQMTDVKLLLIHSNTWNHLTVLEKMSSGPFKNVIKKMCLLMIYLI